MTKRDFINQENIDREQDPQKERAGLSHGSEQPKRTYVKNAHAAGDGSFGRNETGVPEEEENREQRPEDPPY